MNTGYVHVVFIGKEVKNVWKETQHGPTLKGGNHVEDRNGLGFRGHLVYRNGGLRRLGLQEKM